jgi:pilus assembly protein FimV
VQNNDQGASSAKDDDPISEADLFLSFGRDAQAEEILKEALQANPSNEPVKLKLLEIYAKNQNKSGFEKIAKELQSNSNGEAWQQAQSMGKKLDPNNSLYGALVEDAESATMQTISMKQGMIEPSITLNQKTDFDVTANTDGAIDADKTMIFSSADMANAQKAVMDFDVTSTNPSMTVPANMDFDVTAAAPAVDKTLANSNNMIVDVTATHPSMSALSLSDAAPADLGDMEFSLDFPIDPAIASSVKPAEFNLSDISFDLNDTPVASNATMETTDDFNEVATKLDLAKAYQEMGDSVGAREILAEVMRDGNAEQREVAQTIISQLS